MGKKLESVWEALKANDPNTPYQFFGACINGDHRLEPDIFPEGGVDLTMEDGKFVFKASGLTEEFDTVEGAVKFLEDFTTEG